SLNWTGLGIKPGDWTDIQNVPGNPFIDIAGASNLYSLLILTSVIGIVGPFVVGYIYQGGGMRVLFAMARSKYVTDKMKELNKYSVPLWALIVFSVVGAIVAYISAPLPTIYGLISDAVVAGYIGFSVNPVAMHSLISRGKIKPIFPLYQVISFLAFIFAGLIVYWSGWPSVPYAVLLLTIVSVIFSIVYRVKEDFINSIWYIVYIGFLTLLTYIGSVGALSLLNFYYASLVCVIG
ncbi:amino acid transporter, partial [Sulfolobus sp. E3]